MAEAVGPMSGFLKGFDKMFKGFKSSLGPIGVLIDFLDAIGLIEPVVEICIQ